MQSDEADTRMSVHIKHASLTGRATLTDVISDTNVVVLGIAGKLICIYTLCG